MIDIEVLQELHKYSTLYEQRWGKEVDYLGMPASVSQERLLLALRYAVETGDSVLVSLKKIRDITIEFHDQLEERHALHDQELESGYVFDKRCPLCGNIVRLITAGNSYAYVCETKHCFYSAVRGL